MRVFSVGLASRSRSRTRSLSFFFFNDTATTEIYTLSLHDALPILTPHDAVAGTHADCHDAPAGRRAEARDRKSTRLNSSHSQISYAVFCLKKKTHASSAASTGATSTTTCR